MLIPLSIYYYGFLIKPIKYGMKYISFPYFCIIYYNTIYPALAFFRSFTAYLDYRSNSATVIYFFIYLA